MNDKLLMRMKDLILLSISIFSILGIFFSVLDKPRKLEEKMVSVEKILEIRAPVIEANTTKIKVLETQYDIILTRLDRIERKLDRSR